MPNSRECAAIGCPTIIAKSYGMCRKHYYMLPQTLRDGLHSTLKRGQTEDNHRYWLDAIRLIRDKERKENE